MNAKLKTVLKIVLLPVVAGLLLSVNFIKSDVDFETELISAFCGCILANPLNIGKLIKVFSPVMVFTILFGNYVYSDLCKSGIYSVVRYKSRMTFFIKKLVRLMLSAAAFSLFYMLGVWVFLNPERVDKTCVLIMILAFYNMTMMCLALTLFTNLLSFLLGSANGFTAGISVFAFMCIESLINKAAEFESFSLKKLNPVRNYIINWHDWRLLKGNLVWEMGAIKDFTIRFSAAYFLTLCAVLILSLGVIVMRYDIAVSVKEEM